MSLTPFCLRFRHNLLAEVEEVQYIISGEIIQFILLPVTHAVTAVGL